MVIYRGDLTKSSYLLLSNVNCTVQMLEIEFRKKIEITFDVYFILSFW